MGLYTILMVVHSVVVLFLIMLILIQRTDSDGMGGLGGGGGGNQFLTGRAAANLVTRSTAILATIFMISSLVLAVMANRITGHSIVDEVSAEAAAPAVVEKTAEPANDNAKKDAKPEADKKDAAEKPAKAEKSKATPSVPKPE